MVNLKELRKKAILQLSSLEFDSPTADVDSILLSLSFSKSDIIIGEKLVVPELEEKFNKAIKRLAKGEPVQYIAGGCEFMSLWFEVNSATLIPRPDTEILVEAVIDLCKDGPVNILEIGSGSGCIAVSLAHYLPASSILSVDVSEKALETAQKNAENNGVFDRCKFEKCDIMQNFPQITPDVVVSNPPYIPRADIEELERKVKDFEPLTALDGGNDGLDFYRKISTEVKLTPQGILAFEVGINQAADVAEIMSPRFENIQIIKDLSGIDRVVVGILKN